MEPEGSLPHSQEPATCPYPERQGSTEFSKIDETRRRLQAPAVTRSKFHTDDAQSCDDPSASLLSALCIWTDTRFCMRGEKMQ
jgi:hypothetical protein